MTPTAKHEPNFCDACHDECEGERYVLSSHDGHVFWSLSDEPVDQTDALVACSVGCAFELLGMTLIGGRA